MLSLLEIKKKKKRTGYCVVCFRSWLPRMDSKKRRICSRYEGFTFQKAQGCNHHHCCVPLCTAGGRYNKTLSFHSFPKDPDLRSQWLKAIRREGFIVQPNSRVCSRHFDTGEIFIAKSGKWWLQPKTVPSLFHWNNYLKTPRPAVWEHRPGLPQTAAAEEEDSTVGMETQEKPSSGCTELAPASTPFTEDHNYAATSVIHTFGLERFASSPEDTHHYTRFPSYKHLRAFWNLIEESTSRMERVTSGQRNLSTNTPLESPVNRPSKLLPFDEFFLFLNYLATGSALRDLSHTFNIHSDTLRGIIVTWSNFLYSLLGSRSIWKTADKVTTCRTVFNGTYRNTQVILDCPELMCQTPSSLLLQSEEFSPDESHCAFKALIGMSPHGTLTFVSALFESSISDEEIFRRSGIASLLKTEMGMNVDKGILAQEMASGNVHRLLFVSKQAQMSKVDVLRPQSEARLRVHVDRLIKRIKGNKLFDTVIPLSISGSINHIFTVACLLTHYQYGPLAEKMGGLLEV